MEKWTRKFLGAEFVCFKTDNGELFHFRKTVLKRGLPVPPYRTIEELTRPVTMLTLDNAARILGIERSTIGTAIRRGYLPATKKVWRNLTWKRHGLLVDLFDLQEWAARRMLEKHLGRQLEWDTSALGILSKGAKKIAPKSA